MKMYTVANCCCCVSRSPQHLSDAKRAIVWLIVSSVWMVSCKANRYYSHTKNPYSPTDRQRNSQKFLEILKLFELSFYEGNTPQRDNCSQSSTCFGQFQNKTKTRGKMKNKIEFLNWFFFTLTFQDFICRNLCFHHHHPSSSSSQI